jgi:hypothetical protein
MTCWAGFPAGPSSRKKGDQASLRRAAHEEAGVSRWWPGGGTAAARPGQQPVAPAGATEL